MAEVASAFVTLIPSAKGFAAKTSAELSGPLDKAGAEGSKRFGKGFSAGIAGIASRAFAPLAAAAAGIGVASFFKDAVAGASDLNESSTKIEAIFGKATGAVQAFASKGAKSLGQTKLQVLDAAASFGTFGKAAGLQGPSLAKFSTGLAGLSTDLASFFNTSPEEAAQAISSGLRGEAEPLRRYGVLLDDATLRQEALKQGLIKTTKEALTPQQKVLAAQAVIYKQTRDAQGDFAKTSGGLANQQRILTAQFSDFKTTIGTALLPVVTRMVTVLNSTVVPAVMGFVAQVRAGSGVGGAFRAALASVVGVLGTVAGFLTRNRDALLPLVAGVLAGVGAFKVITAVVRAFTAVQAALNLVLAANPIGVVIIALVALVAGIVVAYKTSATFRAVVQSALRAVVTAFTWLRDAAGSVLAWLRANWSLIAAVITGPVGLAVRFVVQHWRQISDGARAMVSAVGTRIGQLVGFFTTLPGKILGAIGDASKMLYNVGRDLIRGALNGIESMAGAIKDKVVSTLTAPIDAAKRKLGIRSPSKVMARQVGRWIPLGVAAGIDAEAASVRASMTSMVGQVARPSLSVGAVDGAAPMAAALSRLHPKDIAAIGAAVASGLTSAAGTTQLSARNRPAW